MSTTTNDDPAPYENLEDALRSELARDGARVLVAGPTGAGKSTLIESLARALPIRVLCVDPGRPLFGAPGAVALGRCDADGWHVEELEALASVDSLRFRLPLVSAACAILERAEPGGAILIDAPGVSRGHSATELLAELGRALGVTSALVLGTSDSSDLVAAAIAQSTERVLRGASHPLARALSDARRHRARTDAWDAFLGEDPSEEVFDARVVGAPPASTYEADWLDRQVAMLDENGRTLGMGVVCSRAPTGALGARWRRVMDGEVRALVVRDARVASGLLRTARHVDPQRTLLEKNGPAPTTAFTHRRKPDYRIHVTGTPGGRGASIRPTFVGNLFEDPMVALRLDHQQRCILLDLGEVRQVPTRIVHQTTDVLVSHAHIDHVGDFPWLLRRLVGIEEPVRLYGPPGITERIANLVYSFTWDRIGERGPRFEVHELRGETMHRAMVRAGADGPVALDPRPAPGGLLLDEPRITIRAAELDHGGTPVLAFSVEESSVFGVRGNLLRERGWKPGAWLGELKKRASARALDGTLAVDLADGTTAEVALDALARDVLIPKPGQKIVYATDFADSPSNREAVVALAQGAHLLACEASFAAQDLEQAERTGHLTAKACAEIARDAGAHLLVPFHLSVRYEENPEIVYSEILEIFDKTYVPAGVLERMKSQARDEPTS